MVAAMTDSDAHIKRRHEAPEVAAGILRMMQALARRAGEGDLEALESLALLQRSMRVQVTEAARALRQAGYSWTDIAGCLGISRQGAQQRFGGDL
jgi:hypothetical protein